MAGKYVALLRGINVGGKNGLPMKELAAMFVAAGCSEVTTYIQSGNVVFGAPARVAERLPDEIGRAIAERFGFQAPIVTRTDAEIRRIAEGNPFLADGADPDKLHVVFLADEPSDRAVHSLDARRSPPDRFVVNGSEIYLHCPDGFGRSKLTNGYFDSKLRTVSTVRNWRTVLKLLELTGA